MGTEEVGAIVMEELKRLTRWRKITLPPSPLVPRRGRVHGNSGSPQRQGLACGAQAVPGTKLILIGIVALIAALAGLLYLAGRSSAVAPDVLGVRPLRALRDEPDDAAGAAVRAGAQHHQAGRRTAPGNPFADSARLVTALLCPLTLIQRAAGAHRRQRAHSQQHRPVLQRADGQHGVVGARHFQRLLPPTAAPRVVSSAWLLSSQPRRRR